jgi:hypothetical protein
METRESWKMRIEAGDGRVVFRDIPLCDAPAFVTDRNLLAIIPALH